MQKWDYMEVRKVAMKAMSITKDGVSEYTFREGRLEDKEAEFLGYLAQLGQQGWELVSHIQWADGNVNIYTFKRPG
jgi:hypothetical protein